MSFKQFLEESLKTVDNWDKPKDYSPVKFKVRLSGTSKDFEKIKKKALELFGNQYTVVYDVTDEANRLS